MSLRQQAFDAPYLGLSLEFPVTNHVSPVRKPVWACNRAVAYNTAVVDRLRMSGNRHGLAVTYALLARPHVYDLPVL
jgi:hypothetical protein